MGSSLAVQGMLSGYACKMVIEVKAPRSDVDADVSFNRRRFAKMGTVKKLAMHMHSYTHRHAHTRAYIHMHMHR